MKRILSLLLCLCLLVPTIALAQEADTEQLDKTFGNIFKRYKTTGGVIVVAKGEEILYQRNYGYSEKKTKTLVTEDTYFRVASVSKLISAIHVMQLVEQGLLDLDEDISTYFGYKIRNPYYKNTPITLRHLMTHTSSLNSNGGYTQSKRTLYSLLGDPAKYRGNFLKRAPGSKYEYSNFGAGIMGSLMEAVTGKNINDTVTEGLFAPLNMDAAYNASLLQVPENVSAGYNSNKARVRSRDAILSQAWDPIPNPEMHYRTTVGSVWMKGRDLCRIGMLLCQGGTLDGVTILQPETVEMMMADQLGQPGMTVSSPYGLAVHRVDNLVRGRMLYGHQGMSNGIVCNVYFDPDTQFVFALVCNGSSNNMNDHICNISRRTFNQVWQAFSGTTDEVKH